MKDLNELIGALHIIVAEQEKAAAFDAVIKEIESFYVDNFFLNEYEVAIFLTNNEKTVLSFACPKYLMNSGMIPVSSTEAFSASIYRTGRGYIENSLHQTKHLSIFEIIRTPEDEVRPLWKMMGGLIAVEEEKLGVIEISRRALNQLEAGDDFSDSDLIFLESSIAKLAPYIKKVIPENFRGRIS